MMRSLLGGLTLATLVGSSVAWAVQSGALSARQTVQEIRYELGRLPRYGVFDFLTFRVASGTVTLEGFAFAASLPEDAIGAVKRVPGVDEVVDRIERLPVSIADDQIRWATFYAIYSDDLLSRYAGDRGFYLDDDLSAMLRYPGTQPVGRYSIHIIVRHGRTLLAGVVDSQMDKQLAAARARGVLGVFSVENGLIVGDDD